MGPRQDAGEDVQGGGREFHAFEASMGPRQDAGEDNVLFVFYAHVNISFNGAPAGCRGRRNKTSIDIKRNWELQWGPGRMPGKTYATLGGGVSAAGGFNGAPAGCRGRLSTG